MNTIGLIYWSGTGNTEAMANILKAWLEDNKADVYFSPVEEADAEAFFQKDILMFGSPAMGAEEIDDTSMAPFIEQHAGKLEGRKVFLFGSYSWADGEFMDNWVDDMTRSKHAVIPVDPVICVEDPDDEAKEALEQAAAVLLEA